MTKKNFWKQSLALARAQFKLRNEGSYLGIFWYLLNPLLMFGLLLLVFSKGLGAEILHYPLYLLLGIIMFNFFQQITTSSIKTMDENRALIKSIKFSRESLVASTVLRTLFSHIFEFILFVVIALIFGVSIGEFIFYIPILLLFCIFAYGFSLILASFYIYFIDIENIWVFVSKLLFFATPIFYEIGRGKLFVLNLFNPLYYFITLARSVVIYGNIPELWIIAGAFASSFIFFVLGTFIFSGLKRRFAELL
jgi:ABC-type polysaccharide/polyol phosphate export permease